MGCLVYKCVPFYRKQINNWGTWYKMRFKLPLCYLLWTTFVKYSAWCEQFAYFIPGSVYHILIKETARLSPCRFLDCGAVIMSLNLWLQFPSTSRPFAQPAEPSVFWVSPVLLPYGKKGKPVYSVITATAHFPTQLNASKLCPEHATNLYKNNSQVQLSLYRQPDPTGQARCPPPSPSPLPLQCILSTALARCPLAPLSASLGSPCGPSQQRPLQALRSHLYFPPTSPSHCFQPTGGAAPPQPPHLELTSPSPSPHHLSIYFRIKCEDIDFLPCPEDLFFSVPSRDFMFTGIAVFLASTQSRYERCRIMKFHSGRL